MKFTHKAQKTFRNLVVLSIVVLAGLAGLVFLVFKQLAVFGAGLWNKLESACGCSDHFSLAMHPVIFSAFAVLGLGLLVGVVLVIYQTIKFKKLNNKFVSVHLKRSKSTVSPNLQAIVSELGLGGRVVEIREQSPTVFCYGFLQPKICVSNSLVRALSKEELRAVIIHERRHLLNRDPLKLFFLKLGEKFFFFVPGFKILVKKYITYSEMAADEEASVDESIKTSLAKALYKIVNQEEQNLLRNGLALSFFSAVIEERVNHLSDSAYIPKFNIFNRQFFISLVALLIAGLSLFVLFKDSSAVLAVHQEIGGSCQMTKVEMVKEARQCEAEVNQKQVCKESYLDQVASCDK